MTVVNLVIGGWLLAADSWQVLVALSSTGERGHDKPREGTALRTHRDPANKADGDHAEKHWNEPSAEERCQDSGKDKPHGYFNAVLLTPVFTPRYEPLDRNR
ncbi:MULTISPECIES: hypothetical protein [unclassified Devosia]|uniref:hypothetical protein n=1 Tax=unclassified Devosia TaxID=196773 RepID=UPI001AC8BD6D|nr:MULTISPECIES: hypothetical protein [unclassified Devosia]MBN9360179.1 hypothetical protein [Devosia sp.]